MKLKRQLNCPRAYSFTSDKANLSDMTANDKVGRFAADIVDESAARDPCDGMTVQTATISKT